MNLDRFKGKRMVHEDDKKYLEDLVYYHPDPAAIWAGDTVEAGYGIDITLTPETTIAIDTDVVLTRPNLTDYSIGHIIAANSEIDTDNVNLQAVYSQDVKSEISAEPTSTIIRTMSGTDVSTIGVSATEIDLTTSMLKYNSSEVATKADLADKQDTLTAGDNITIDSDNVISAVDTTYTAGDNITIDSDNVISATVKTYTAGTNITIDANDVISATDTTYTAGTNITIDANNVISATNTTYTGVDYVDVNSTDNEIGLDATGKAAVDLVDGHMTESQGSITISDVNQINVTNYVLDADGYLVNESNGDIKFGTQNANGSVYGDLYMISGGEGWYLETNNANVSTSVALDTTVMTQDTAYEFKQDGIYLNNTKITKDSTEGTVVQHVVSTAITVIGNDTPIDSLNLTPGVWVVELYANYNATQVSTPSGWGSMSLSVGSDVYNAGDALRYPICNAYNTNGIKMSSTYKITSNTTIYLHFWNAVGPIDYSYIFKAIRIA